MRAVLAAAVALALLVSPVSAADDGPDGSPDTGLDLHAAMLGSGAPDRSGPAGTLQVAEEFGVYSLRPDGRWMTFDGFDVAGAGFTKEFVQIHLAGRLMEDGEVFEDTTLSYEDAFINWKVLYGPAGDPYRHIGGLLHPTPWGTTISLPAEDLDHLALLVGSDVRGHEDVALVVGVSESDTGTIELPFPGAFGPWMRGWTEGKKKVRLVEDHWGHGTQLALWAFGPSFTSDNRRGVAVEDERPRAQDVAGPGALRLSAAMHADGPSLSTTLLFYEASAAAQLVDLEWRTPTETRQHSELNEIFFIAMATDGGPGEYAVDLEVNTAVEASRRVTYIHDLWALDPADVFPGLRERSDDDDVAGPLVLAPGTTVPGATPSVVIGVTGPDAGG